MKVIRTPNNIEVLLHYYSCPFPHPRFDAGAVKEATGEFLVIGAITADENNRGCYKTTPLGSAWVQALCNVPPPKPAFIDEHGNVLKSQ